MGHKHSVYDSDTHFSINPITRMIRNDASRKTVLIQGDHNSERFTFELPRRIEGHDMSKCDAVEVHYLNIASDKKDQKSGVYTVEDLQVSPDDDQVVVCSWLISQNATQLVGSLNFLLRFRCVENDLTTYVWNTAVHDGIRVSDGINGGETLEADYLDIIEQWKASVIREITNDVNDNVSAWAETESGKIRGLVLEETTKTNAALAVERARIDLMQSDATADDAELIDIRVGADGKTYGSAGTAVREQFDAIRNDAPLPDAWSAGYYNPLTGELGNTDGFMYFHGDVPVNITEVYTVDESAHIILYAYHGDEYIGAWQKYQGAFVQAGVGGDVSHNIKEFRTVYPGYSFRLAVNYLDYTGEIDVRNIVRFRGSIYPHSVDITALSQKVNVLHTEVDKLSTGKYRRLSDVFAPLILSDAHIRIKLLGDSITYGACGTGCQSNGDEIGTTGYKRNPNGYCWANLFRDLMESKHNCTVINNGIGGKTSSYLVTNLSQLVDDEDDIVILMIGTNDRFGGTMQKLHDNIITIYNYCMEKGAELVLMSCIPEAYENEHQTTDIPYIRKFHMEDVSDVYMKLGNALRMEYVELYQYILQYARSHNIPHSSMYVDGTHPTDATYKLMYEHIVHSLGFATPVTLND